MTQEDVLMARLERLEKGNRRLKMWLVLMTLGAVLLGVGLGVLATSMPFSVVRSPFGGPRITMTAFGNASTMSFWNAGEKSRLQLGTTPMGAAVFVTGREGKARISLTTIDQNGKDIPSLTVYDATNPKAAFQVDFLKDDSPQLTMTSPVGKGRVHLWFLPGGDPVLRLTGTDGSTLFETPHPVEAAPSAETGQ